MATKIEWCDETINPFVGCSKCSPGCDNCFAEKMARRQIAMGNKAYEGTVDENGHWTGKINWQDGQLDKIAKWKKPRRIFIGSMTDCFHENIPQSSLFDVINIIAEYPQHIFIMLTKRPHRMKEQIDIYCNHYRHYKSDPLPNLWLGVTVCNQQEADEKIPILLQTPAAKRFVSIEPMLGAMDLTRLNIPKGTRHIGNGDVLNGVKGCLGVDRSGYEFWRTPTLDWVICGGETGDNARPMNPEWVRSLRDQCVNAGVPFFFKSWGEYTPNGYGKIAGTWLQEEYIQNYGGLTSEYINMFHKRNSFENFTTIDGQEWKQFPEDDND